MEQLTIIGTEGDQLVLVTEAGDRYALVIDDVLRTELKKAARRESAPEAPHASPRDIQTHIRAGLSTAEVAELLGTTVEAVQRYEGPVLAEREHIVSQALAVPVLVGSEVEPDGTLSFGMAIRAKLAEAEASGERWTSWKGEEGWIVKLEFVSAEVEHDARWGFDPRRSTLSPQNSAATQLSRQGSLPEGLIPRLRALDTTPAASATPWKDESRFDSGAFGPRRLPDPAPTDAETNGENSQRPSTAADAAMNRAPEPDRPTHPDTADLLEALRRRRGQREPAPALEDEAAPGLVTAPAPLARIDAAPAATPAPAETGDDAEIVAEKQAAAERDNGKSRRGRPSMPSWDEIVFGARTED
ncbi:septation protein SepH [Microbacterium gorillae]|uniref:septation protein SepH n=1 Tax=Microbacterium gorillae TaxID=1231063 RepID=UPI003D954B80